MDALQQKKPSANKRIQPLKVYAIVATLLFVVIFAAFLVVFTHAGYHTKVLVKLGLKEPVTKTNHAILAWENCLKKADLDADVVFFGDSITYESNFAERYPQCSIVNLGYSGDTLAGMTSRIPMVQAVAPEKIFVLGGINGLTDANIPQSVAQYDNLLTQLQAALPDAEIYIQSVLPIGTENEVALTNVCHNETILTFNEHLQELANQHGCDYIDLHTLYYRDGELDPGMTYDGLHLKQDAYSLWNDAIAPYMVKK